MKLVVTREPAAERLLVLLPREPVSADAVAHWWRLAGTDIVDCGCDDRWLERGRTIIGVAPTERIRLDFSDPGMAAATRQQLTVARLAAVEGSLADGATLHAVAAPAVGSGIAVALAANDAMIGWIDWAERHGADLGPIVPAAMAVPLGEQWVRAVIGSDRLVARTGMVFPDEASLSDALVEGEVGLLDPDQLGAGLAALAANPSPNLRSGLFARRQVFIDRARFKLIAALVVAIVLVTTLTALVQIAKMDRSTAALDAETLSIAQKIGGAGVTIETAEAAVAARAGGSGGLSGPLAGLFARLQQERAVTIATLGYAPGQVTTTLAAPGAVDANRVVAALQRDGYRVSAVPRASSDGRTLLDVTIRDGM